MLIVKINGNRDYPIQKKSTYEYFTEKIESLNQRIEELASGERYQEKVKNLVAGTPGTSDTDAEFRKQPEAVANAI